MRLTRLLSILLGVGLIAAPLVWAAKFGLNDVKGRFSFSLSATAGGESANGTPMAQSIQRVGMLHSDGKGVLTGRAISVLDDGSDVTVIDYTWNGTYTVDEDGTGRLTIAAPVATNITSCVDGAGAPLAGCEQALDTEHFAFALIVGKKDSTLALIQTDAPATTPRLFLRGTATTQEVKGGGGGGFSLF